MWSANLAWAVEFDPDAVKDLKKLDRPVQVRILAFLRTRLAPLKDQVEGIENGGNQDCRDPQ